MIYFFFFLPHLGTQASFRRLYEEPIVRGQQPDASGEEKLLGQTRATEVSKMLALRLTQKIVFLCVYGSQNGIFKTDMSVNFRLVCC